VGVGRHDFDEVEVCRGTVEDFTAQVLDYASRVGGLEKDYF